MARARARIITAFGSGGKICRGDRNLSTAAVITRTRGLLATSGQHSAAAAAAAACARVHPINIFHEERVVNSFLPRTRARNGRYKWYVDGFARSVNACAPELGVDAHYKC